MQQILLVSFLLFSSFIDAALIEVFVTDDLQQQLDNSTNGDTILLGAGTYQGNFVITNSITLTGKKGAVIDALGQGHALQIMASDTAINNLTILNWGSDLTDQNAGIYSDVRNQNITLKNNILEGDGFGIWMQRADHVLIENNRIKGNLKLRSADRGNGIQLSSVRNALVINNTVTETRDGLYIIASEDSELRNNTLFNLRYGIHYMYSHHNKVLNNRAYNTRAGFALMSSKELSVKGNESRDSEDYGMLMNFITYSTISHNYIKNVWTKAENKVPGREGKGLFIYNSAYNTISHNLIEQAEIGIHLTAGSENGKIFGNSFINNLVQVKYVSNRHQEWSYQGVGNYWSNYLGWDLDDNGTGDTPFVPNDAIDKLVWQYPEAKVLLDSPAILLLRWVQDQFPILKPGGVKDSFPLMNQPLFEGYKYEK
ncbi:MAG: nitrous oxide reductase family maturation protein NosD [Colwellia sp.]